MYGMDDLKDKLIKNLVVFFLGSGVSYSSSLPSAEDILRGTCEKLLPALHKEHDWIVNTQPEVVYATLLECSNFDARCLDMWKCLSPAKWTKEYCPEANFEHCFIVAYSKRAKVPIFTVNYDTMFEDACKKLGIAYTVVTEYHQLDLSSDVLYICKLHGDIGGIGDSVNPNIFKTTMSEISKKNKPWLDYLFQIMKTKHICFAGYSGRDIDYYPLLKQQLNEGQQVCPSFWTLENKMDRENKVIAYDPGWENAIAITRGQIIEKFPSNFFSGIYEAVFGEDNHMDTHERQRNRVYREALRLILSTASPDSSALSLARKRFLTQIAREIREVKLSQELFWMRFLQLQGKNKESEYVFQKQLDSHVSEFEVWEQQLIWDTKMTLEREHAQFLKYRNSAKKMRRIARVERKRASGQEELEKARGQELNAWVQVLASHQMEVPARLYFKLPLRLKGYGRLVAVKLGFCLLDMTARFAGASFGQTNAVIIHESRLKSYAIDAGLAEKLLKSNLAISQWFVKRVIDRLKKLREAAYKVGNYETLIGTMKYLARLIPKDNFGAEAKVFGTLVSNLSAVSIIKRDSFKSDEEFREALADAKENDNTLNIIKVHLKNAFDRIEAKKGPFPDEKCACELWSYMETVESTHLQKCFAYIREAYF